MPQPPRRKHYKKPLSEKIQKNLAKIEAEEKLKDHPRLVFSPYAENIRYN